MKILAVLLLCGLLPPMRCAPVIDEAPTKHNHTHVRDQRLFSSNTFDSGDIDVSGQVHGHDVSIGSSMDIEVGQSGSKSPPPPAPVVAKPTKTPVVEQKLPGSGEAEFVKNIEYIFNGYDIMKGNPLPVEGLMDPGYRNSIFEVTYASGSKTPDGLYLQPDGTTITDCSNTCSLSFDSILISGSRSYQDTLSAKASLSLGYTGFGYGAKFSASASFKEVQNTTSSGSHLFTLSSATCCSYKAEIHGFNGPPLSQNFLMAVKTLTDEYKEDVYLKLIQNFGTHYIMEAHLGSLYGIQSEVSKEAWSKLQQKGYSVGTAAEVSAYGVTFEASFENSKQKEMSEDFQKSVTSRKSFTIGVKPPTDQKIESWIQETSNDPDPISLRLNSIMDLFNGSHGIEVTKAVKENIRKALEDYCPLLMKQGEVSTCEAPGPDPLKPGSNWEQIKSDDCWSSCGKKDGGACSWCGSNGFCCRKGFDGCPSGAGDVSPDRHRCVRVKGSNWELIKSDDCWNKCGKKGGACSWCGSKGYCCRKGFDGCPFGAGDISPDIHRCVREKVDFLNGVNYGNRFVPEDWMESSEKGIFGNYYGPSVKQPKGIQRVSLCDVEDDRILRVLDDRVKEDDFRKMQQYGVKLIRVPTGYWNWVDLGDFTPNCPDNLAGRFRNLQSVKPKQYEPYLDKIYKYASYYGIKVFMELHGAPGSQNGEVHSGCVTGPENRDKKYLEKPTHYFNTDWNKEIAVNAIGKISEKCKKNIEVCWGVGVLNEPQPSYPSPTADELHAFLSDYYHQAILKARQSLSWDTPVVLFSWHYDFWRWPDGAYPYDQYGKIMWDTHLYYPITSSVDVALSSYDEDLNKIQAFQRRIGADVIVGEFGLSNLNFDDPANHITEEDKQQAWQSYADRVFPKIQEKANGGALLWNWDCRHASWSMEGIAEIYHVQWNL